MTPQEKDLITALLSRLQQAANRPRDPEADALIGQAMRDQPDAPYFLVQTVLIQDMSLSEAQRRISELERALAAAKAAPAAAPTSFLGDARRSAPPAGPWSAPAPATGPVWTQSTASPPAQPTMMAPPAVAPWAVPGASSGFLQQAMATAAGVAGGALLFEGIQSMFGPHYGSMLGGIPMQPGINETVINNYYGDAVGHDAGSGPVSDPGYSTDPGFDNSAGGIQSADDLPSDDCDFGNGGDFGDDGSYDV